MNKKLAMIGAGVMAGSVLLMSSVYAGVGSTPGYTAYKSAIKNTTTIENATLQARLSIEDNGKRLLQVDSTVKSGKDNVTSSAEFTLLSGNTEQNVQIFSQDDKKIIKTSGSDVYRIVEMDPEARERLEKYGDGMDQHDPAFTQEVENVIDTLVGNLKNNVTLKEEGSAKEIGLHLEGSQIPAIVNAVGSLLNRKGGDDHGEDPELQAAHDFGLNMYSIKDSLPKLTDEIKIENVSLDADVNADNLITNQTAEIKVSGKDSQGLAHEVVIKLVVNATDFNNTTPNTVDLTGKKTENVKSDYEERSKGWHK